jgi:hypothetical protein
MVVPVGGAGPGALDGDELGRAEGPPRIREADPCARLESIHQARVGDGERERRRLRHAGDVVPLDLQHRAIPGDPHHGARAGGGAPAARDGEQDADEDGARHPALAGSAGIVQHGPDDTSASAR